MPSPVSAALAALAFHRPAYDEAQQFYDGTVPEVMSSQRMRVLLGPASDAFRINYARTPVDVLVERTMVQGITCSNADQQATLTTVWEDNELGLEAKDIHRRAYEFGDAYLIGWVDDELPGKVSAYAHDPVEVRVFYAPGQPRKKSHAVHSWRELGDESDAEGSNGLGAGWWHRVNLYYPDRVERYVSSNPVANADGSETGIIARQTDDFTLYENDGDEGVITYQSVGMPVGIVPVFHFRTGRPYGRPEHADAYGPQNGINKLMASMMGAVDYQVFPQRYALTESALTGDAQPDLFDEGDTDANAGLSADSDMTAGPGETWLLSGKNVRVGQFDAADMDNFLKPKNDLVESMAAVTDLPLDRYTPRAGQEPSGESQRMREIPLNKKTSDRFMQFGVTWREFFRFCLAVNAGGRVQESDATVAWAPPEAYSDKTSWETAQLQLDAGVPYDQVLRERGYADELIKGWQDQLPDGVPPSQATAPGIVVTSGVAGTG